MLERLRKVYELMTPTERGKLPLLGVLVLINSLLESVSIGMLFPLLMLISDTANALKNPYIAYAYNASGLTEPNHFIYATGVAVFLLLAFKNIVGFGISVWNYRIGQQIGASLSGRLFGRYMHAPYSWHVQSNSAELIRNADGAVTQTISGVIIPAIAVINELLIVAGIVLVLVLVDPVGSISIGLFVALIGFVIHRFTRNRNTWAGKRVLETHAELLKTMQQGVGAIKEIRILGREAAVAGRYGEQRNESAYWRTMAGALQMLPRYVVETALAFAVITMLIAMIHFRGAETAIPALGLIAVAALRLLPSTNRILTCLQQMRAGWHAVDLVSEDYQLLDRLAATNDDAPQKATSDNRKPTPAAHNGIELVGVSFRYPNRSESVTDDINLAIKWGESIGFVGASGAGKTTLIDLIVGVLVPQQGSILIDGKDMAQDRRGWQRRIGYVPQSVFLFDDTLARNIALGLDDEEIDVARLKEAAHLACLQEFLAEVPGGLNAQVGEKGVRISGGQRQRVGIARALYRNPDVLVLDEATASVDSGTEAQLSEVIANMSGKKTVLVVAHRLSTVKSCDRIVLLKQGRISDISPFDELAARNHDFARMVSQANVQHGVLAQ